MAPDRAETGAQNSVRDSDLLSFASMMEAGARPASRASQDRKEVLLYIRVIQSESVMQQSHVCYFRVEPATAPRSRFSLSLFAALVVIGLVSDARAQAGIGPVDVEWITVIGSPRLLEPGPISREERSRLSQESSGHLRGARRILKTSVTWQEAHERMQSFVEADESVLTRRANTAASLMLQSGAFELPDTPELLETVGHYVDVLIELGSPDAVTILPWLERLQGYWDADRVRAAAASSLERADAAEELRIRRNGRAMPDLPWRPAPIPELEKSLSDKARDRLRDMAAEPTA